MITATASCMTNMALNVNASESGIEHGPGRGRDEGHPEGQPSLPTRTQDRIRPCASAP